jgi:hypothetical protein
MPVMAAIETKDIITFCIAVYGAALSSFVFYRSLVRERRWIVIKQTAAFYTYPQGLGPPMASIEVINRGHRPVVVNGPQFQLPNGQNMLLINADGMQAFPKRLEDGEKAEVRMGYDAIADSLRKAGYSGQVVLRPTCTDTTGEKFKGKKWKFDISTDWWAKI